MIEPMAKVRLVAPRNLVERVTAVLQEAGVLHIESEPAEALRIALRPQTLDESVWQRQVELERLREELRRLLVLLPEPIGPFPVNRSPFPADGARNTEHGTRRTEERERIVRTVRQVSSRAEYLAGRLKTCEDELSLLAKYEKALEALTPFLRLIQKSEELDHLGVTFEEREPDHHVLPLLHEMMAKVTDQHYELFHSRVDERTLAVLLVFPKIHAARIRTLLAEEGISELRLPASVSDKPLGQALRIILKKKVELPRQVARYREELAEVSRAWRPALESYLALVTGWLEQIEATSLYYQTELTTFVYGWVPRRALAILKVRIDSEFSGTVVLEDCPLDRKDWSTVPVALANPPFLKPFEVLTRLIALPRYGSIDPTPYLAVFFPLFYGLILGDVGYGLLLFAAAWVVKQRYGHRPLLRDLSVVFLVASASAVLCGVLFGELFGELGERIGLHPLLNRLEAFIPLLSLAIGIGTLHVSLGMVLGMLWAWRQGEWRECLVKLGGLTLVLSFVCLIATLSGLLPRGWTRHASAGLLLSLAIIFGFGGAHAAMELHSLVNVLSYLRLMGIGVASAALAFAANKLGALVGNALLAIVVGGTLHAINLAFGILSPTVQSLRLHYVEFFENFFAPGGRPYRPFKRAA